MKHRKWDLVWADLDPNRGREQKGRRPVLIFCNDVISGAIGLVSVLPLTTLKPGRRVYPTEVLLRAGTAGLGDDSLVMCHQIRTLSIRRLSDAIGNVRPRETREAISRALRIWLDFS